MSAEPIPVGPQPPTDARGSKGRLRGAFSGSRELVRIAYRDPEHVVERLALYTTDRLADGSREWAQVSLNTSGGSHPAGLSETQRTEAARLARIDGAVSGTPFLIALVPGYLTYLVLEMRMMLRIAALHGRDPAAIRTAAEMLALRGVHPSIEAAQRSLIAVRDAPKPERPRSRRPLRSWLRSIRQLLIMGGFISPSTAKPPKSGARERFRAAVLAVVGIIVWVGTWVLPVTLMIVMAWTCETRTRQLGRRAILYYGGNEASVDAAIATADRGHEQGADRRAILRTIGLFLSVAVPIAFVAYMDHVRNTVGINWLGALGALVALSLVLATAVIATRR